MPLNYKTVYAGGEAELVEKKSRFIAKVYPVVSEEEAAAYIEAAKKQNWDASHNCYAYVIGERSEIQRFSDDGEPGGTAGRPILEVLLGEEIHNTLIIVTRYFGGTLLGTGGLVRAYGGSAKAGLLASTIITKIHGCKLHIATDYTGLGKIQYILGQRGIAILDSQYTDTVALEVLAADEDIPKLTAEITEGTNGQAIMKPEEECWFAYLEGKAKIL